MISESSNLPRRPPLDVAASHARELVRMMSRAGLGACGFAVVDNIIQYWRCLPLLPRLLLLPARVWLVVILRVHIRYDHKKLGIVDTFNYDRLREIERVAVGCWTNEEDRYRKLGYESSCIFVIRRYIYIYHAYLKLINLLSFVYY